MLCEKCSCDIHVGPEYTIPEIIKKGAHYFNVPEDLILSRCRERWVVIARYHIIQYLLSKNITTIKIGKELNKDHSSIYHAKMTMMDLMSYDQDVKSAFEKFKKYVNQ